MIIKQKWRRQEKRDMVVLIDTNVIMDFMMKREPHAEDAIRIINLCNSKKLTGYIAAHTISNLFYILRKDFSVLQRKEMLTALCGIFGISGIDRSKIMAALDNQDFADFEDCLQMECASEIGAEYIITRNISDFLNSRISVMEPRDFLEMIDAGTE